ncbi:MAG: fosfomycin resistance glutathione transferase [Marinobacter sp.]|nr:fosfomycin resistance glutathione transferase [Marinobacter sp.]
MLRGLNHLTLAVSDLDRSLSFYRDLLGFQAHVCWAQGAYLSLGELWLCLSVGAVDCRGDYTHIAFDIAAEDFQRFAAALRSAGVREWKQNCSEGDSLYFLDPDGHQLEAHVGSLDTRLKALIHKPYKELAWL